MNGSLSHGERGVERCIENGEGYVSVAYMIIFLAISEGKAGTCWARAWLAAPVGVPGSRNLDKRLKVVSVRVHLDYQPGLSPPEAFILASILGRTAPELQVCVRKCKKGYTR